MKFFIAMPVLNGATYLRRAVESVLEQSHDCWSLAICDGGSTDASCEISNQFSERDPRIRFYQESDCGIYDALQKAFDGASGDVFSWLNADDMYLPWAFAHVADLFADRSKFWVSGYPAIWDETNNLQSVVPVAPPPPKLIRDGWMHDELLGCIQQETTFFSAHLWHGLSKAQKQRFATLKLAGDFYLWTQFAKQARLHFTPSVLGGFRRHESNRSVTQRDQYQREVYECGGRRLPTWLARKARGVHDLLAARRALYAARAAMAHHAKRSEE